MVPVCVGSLGLVRATFEVLLVVGFDVDFEVAVAAVLIPMQ